MSESKKNEWIGVRLIETHELSLSRQKKVKLKAFIRTKKVKWLQDENNKRELLKMTENEDKMRYYNYTLKTSDGELLEVTFTDWTSDQVKRQILLDKLHKKTHRPGKSVDKADTMYKQIQSSRSPMAKMIPPPEELRSHPEMWEPMLPMLKKSNPVVFDYISEVLNIDPSSIKSGSPTV